MAELQELKAPQAGAAPVGAAPVGAGKPGAPIHKESPLKTVLGALDVLEFLGTQEGFARLTDISASLGLAKGKVHRLLRTLLSRNYVIQDPATRGYSLGLSAWVLGREAREIRSLVDTVQPQMEELCSLSQETVILSVLEGYTQITLYTKRGPQLVHVFVREGALAPLHATATGKAILTLLDEEYLRQLAALGLQRYTPRTITTLRGLVREIEAAREQGYATAVDEWAADLSAVSAGLLEKTRGTYLSLGIAFPTSRVSTARMRELGELVKQKSEEAQRFLEG